MLPKAWVPSYVQPSHDHLAVLTTCKHIIVSRRSNICLGEQWLSIGRPE